jgi:hypothetical protein
VTEPTTLVELFVQARDVLGPERMIVPLVLLRLDQGRPEDAAARCEMAEMLGDLGPRRADRP